MFSKKFISVTIGLIAILALAGCGLPAVGSTPTPAALGPCANPLLPTVQGATWHYDMTGTTTDVFTRSITTSSASGFSDQDIFHDLGATRTGNWTCSGGTLTAQDVVGGSAGTASRPSPLLASVEFQTTDSSGVTLPAHIAAGDTWTQTTSLDGTAVVNLKNVDVTSDVTVTYTAAGIESVVVPAGTFDAMRIDMQIDQTITTTIGDNPPAHVEITYTTSNWYAPNIGLVKSVTSGTNLDTTITLASYTIP